MKMKTGGPAGGNRMFKYAGCPVLPGIRERKEENGDVPVR